MRLFNSQLNLYRVCNCYFKPETSYIIDLLLWCFLYSKWTWTLIVIDIFCRWLTFCIIYLYVVLSLLSEYSIPFDCGFSAFLFDLCTYQWFAPGWGGATHGNLILWNSTWVGILTSTTAPWLGEKFDLVAILENREGLGVSGPPSWKMPRSHLNELSTFFARPFSSWAILRSILMFLKQTIVVFNIHQLCIFKVS